MVSISPQAESFLLSGAKDTACLFIHGFTASPSEVFPVARLIHEKTNYTVSGPLLPGHGSSPQELNQTGWEDWFRKIEQEIELLQKNHTRIFVAGLSMGGLLSLQAAHNANINGVIAINTPILTKSHRLMALTPLLRYLKPYYPKKVNGDSMELQRRGRFAYSVMPIKALQSMHVLRDTIIQGLPELNLPILLFQSRWDETVDPRSARYIRDKALNAQVELIELENSGHIATMGNERQLIAEKIVEFIA